MSSSSPSSPNWKKVAIGVLIGAAVVIGGLIWSVQGLSTDSGEATLWMKASGPEREAYDEFTRQFGGQNSLLISWDDCRADSAIVKEIADLIIERDQVEAKEEGRSHYFNDATTYRGLRDELSSQFVSEAELDKRLKDKVRGFLVAEDLEAGVIVLSGNQYSVKHCDDAFELARSCCIEKLGEEVVLKFAGDCFLVVSANIETKRTLGLISPVVAVVSLLVALLLFRNPILGLLAFGVSGIASLMSMAAIAISGHTMGDMLGVVPSLAQLLAMSNAVHLINYYSEDWLRHRDSEKAWRYAVKVGWKPTLAASLTTIIGFVALMNIGLPVVSDFAVFGSIGVACAALVVLTLVPAVLILVKPKVKPPYQWENRFVGGLNFLSQKWAWPLSGVMVLLLVGGGLGLMQLKSEIRMASFYPERSQFRKDYNWFNEKFRSSAVSELMVTVPKSVGGVEQIEFIENLSQQAAELDDRYVVLSPLMFLLGIPDAIAAGAPERALIYKGAWEEMKGTKAVPENEKSYHWRISIKHPSDPNPEESEFLDQIQPLLANVERTKSIPARVDLTGRYQLFSQSQSGLLDQLLKTFLWAFVIITPIIILFLRSLKLGLIAILGNLFPLVVFFGLMGWLGLRIEIATMLIATVAFGIAVDDTVHFLTWLGRGYKRHPKDSSNAIRFAFQNCAGAILQTTLIISIGMMSFLLSDFLPSVKFATYTAVVLFLAMIGDLVFLPAVIQALSKGRRKGIKS